MSIRFVPVYRTIGIKEDTAITVLNDGNGTAVAASTKTAVGAKVMLTASPKEEYHFKEWQVVSDSITINGNDNQMAVWRVLLLASDTVVIGSCRKRRGRKIYKGE